MKMKICCILYVMVLITLYDGDINTHTCNPTSKTVKPQKHITHYLIYTNTHTTTTHNTHHVTHIHKHTPPTHPHTHTQPHTHTHTHKNTYLNKEQTTQSTKS